MRADRQAPWRLVIHESLPSTSEFCRRLAMEGEPEGLAALALRQTQGRGSRGRAWDSPLGNLYLSVLLRPAELARDAGQWSLLAGVALAEALQPLLPGAAELRLKWPNDALLGGAKLAGTLVDSAATADGRLDWVVIGIGVNLAVAPEVPDRETACVAQVASPPDPQSFATRLLDQLAAWRGRREREGFGSVRTAWLRHAGPLGAPTSLRVGERRIVGAFAGLDAEGGLLLDTGTGVQAFCTGEVVA